MRQWLPTSLTSPQLVFVGLSSVLTIALLVAVATSGTAFGTYNPGWDGTSELRSEADAADADPIIADTTTRYETLPANETIAFILAPDDQYGPGDQERIRAFVERGGTVVIADDIPTQVNPLLAGIGATTRIEGAPLRDERNYYRSPALPRATNATNHSLVEDVDSVTLNHGTALQPGNATVVVGTSEYAYLDRNRNEELDETETLGERPVVTVETIGDGRVITTSDASIFINVMIDRADNRAFVTALVADQDRVVIDISHGDALPPLVAMLVALRNSAILQLLVGSTGIATIAAWNTGWLGALRRRVVVRLRGRRGSRPPGNKLSESDVAALLDREYPDWDEQHRERVMTVIMNRDGQDRDNE